MQCSDMHLVKCSGWVHRRASAGIGMFHLLFTVRRNVRIASAGIYYLFAMEVEGAVLCQCQSVAA